MSAAQPRRRANRRKRSTPRASFLYVGVRRMGTETKIEGFDSIGFGRVRADPAQTMRTDRRGTSRRSGVIGNEETMGMKKGRAMAGSPSGHRSPIEEWHPVPFYGVPSRSLSSSTQSLRSFAPAHSGVRRGRPKPMECRTKTVPIAGATLDRSHCVRIFLDFAGDSVEFSRPHGARAASFPAGASAETNSRSKIGTFGAKFERTVVRYCRYDLNKKYLRRNARSFASIGSTHRLDAVAIGAGPPSSRARSVAHLASARKLSIATETTPSPESTVADIKLSSLPSIAVRSAFAS